MTTNTEQLLRELASEALLTLDGIADTNPRDRADFENKDEWITWAKSRAKWAADKLRAPISRELLAERVLKQMLEQDAALTQPAQAGEGGEAYEAIYAAWKGCGLDIAQGTDWRRFVGMLPPLYTAPPASQERTIDAEALIVACVPGGSFCDPQQVADAIRAYMALRPQAVPMTDAGSPGLKRHAIEASDRLARYAAAPFFPETAKRGVVRQTTPEWWDGLAELIEEAQPLIARAQDEFKRAHHGITAPAGGEG